MEAKRSFVQGLFEAVCVVVLFIVGGLGWAVVLGGGALPAGSGAPILFDLRSAPPRCARTEGACLYFPDVEQPPPLPRVWLVDGYNVLNVGLLAGRTREGWWSSRFRDELLGRVEAFEEDEAEIWVVFDGARPPDAARAGRVRSVFAPSADEWLLARIGERDGERITLVTADRRLADRARHRGALVVAPAEFLARCRALG